MKERTISLRKMFWDVVLSWRSIVLCGIIGALLFGTAYYVKSVRNSEEINAEPEIEGFREEFTPDELEDIDMALNLHTRLNAYQKRLDESLLGQVSITDINKVSILYYVDVAENDIQIKQDVQGSSYNINWSKEEQESSIMALYAYALNDVQLLEEISKIVDLDITAIQELMNIQYTENVLRVSVLYTEEMDIDGIIAVINDFVLQQDYSEVMDYSISCVDKIYEKPAYIDLLDQKQQGLNDVYNIQVEYEQQIEKLNALQQKYVNSIISDETENEREDASGAEHIDTTSDNTSHISKKYIFIGFCIGVFLVCFYAVCRRIFSSSLIDEDHIVEMYDVKIFGVMGLPRKKRFLAKIDQILFRIRDRRKKRLTDEQKYKAAISSVVLECKQKDIRKLCITGTDIENINDDIISRLRDDLKKNDIEMEKADNIVYDGESLKDCVEAGHVVILEQMGKSLYGEINSEVKKMNEYNICILGALILN